MSDIPPGWLHFRSTVELFLNKVAEARLLSIRRFVLRAISESTVLFVVDQLRWASSRCLVRRAATSTIDLGSNRAVVADTWRRRLDDSMLTTDASREQTTVATDPGDHAMRAATVVSLPRWTEAPTRPYGQCMRVLRLFEVPTPIGNFLRYSRPPALFPT